MFQRSGIELVVDTSDLDSIVRKADAADESLNRIVDSANEIEGALSGIGDVDVAVDVEADPAGLDELMTSLDEIDNEAVTAEVDTEADTQSVDELMAELETVDTEETTAQVDAQVSNIDRIQKLLDILANIKIVADGVVGGIKAIGSVLGTPVQFAVDNFLDMDNALDSIEARTGRMIPDAERLVKDIYEAGWGESRDEIANLVIEMDHLHIATSDFEQAATSAFQAAQVTGKDVNDVLETMNQMVQTGIADNFQEAADVIVAGFQNGADKGGDFLQVLNKNAPILKDMGLDAESFTNILVSGLDEGFTSASQMSDSLLMLRTRLSDGSKEVQDTLAALNLTDLSQAYLSGQTSGEEFLEGLSTALAAVEDPAKQLEYTNTLFGRQGRTIGQDAITGLQNIGDELGNIEGRADQASDVLQRDFGESVERVFRTLEDRVIGFLSSDQIDLPGKLDILEGQLQDFLNNVETGKSIAESIDIAFQLEPGSFEGIESAFNNIALGFLQAIQTVLQVLGKGKEADALQSTIAGYAQGQFEFDLRLADNGEGLRDTIQTAIDRGIDPKKITDTLQDSVEDMLARGDLLGANKLIDQIKEQATVPITIRGIEFGPDVSQQDILNRLGFPNGNAELQQEIDEAFSVRNINTDSLQENAQILGEMYTDKLNEAIAAGDYSQSTLDLAKQVGTPEQIQAIQFMVDQQAALADQTDQTAAANESASVRTTTAVDDTEQSVRDYVASSGEQLDINAEKFVTWEASVTKNVDAVSSKIDSLAVKVGGLNASLGELGTSDQPAENAGTQPAQPHAGGGTAYGRSLVGEEGAEIVDFPDRAGIINAANTSTLMRALDSFMGAHGVSGGNTTNIYLNNSVSTQNMAQADAYGYKFSRAVRGFA